jgi:5-methylcytosine-specific restriction endonuclease McrA
MITDFSVSLGWQLGREMYRVMLTVTQAQAYPGIRRLLFEIASKNAAMYNNDTNSHITSFKYIGDKKNLKVNVLLWNRPDAIRFIHQVRDDLKYFKFVKCALTTDPIEAVQILNDGQLVCVDITDYENKEMGSPFLDEEKRSVVTRSSDQTQIAKTRDEFTCKACGKSFAESKVKSELEGAHILNVEEVEAAKSSGGQNAVQELLASVHLISAAQDTNIISLCSQCHNHYFDKDKICINYDSETQKYFWEVKEEVEDDDMPGQQGKYGDIRGDEINFPWNIGPPPELIQHRMNHYMANTTKKRKTTAAKVSY